MKYTIIGGVPEPSGGVTIFNGDLVELLAEQGHRVVVFDQNPGSKHLRFKDIDLRVWNGKYIFNFHVWVFFSVLWTSADRYILHTSNICGVFRVFMPLILKKRCSVFFHNGDLKLAPCWTIANLLIRWLLALVDKIYVMSNKQMGQLIELGCDANKIQKINPVLKLPASQSESSLPLNQRELLFLACGHEARCYRYEFLVRFAQSIPGSCVHLFIYGAPTDPVYLNELRAIDVNNVLKISRDKSKNEFLAALAKARMFARPNNVDSFGVSVLDALQVGTPVVASDVCERPTGAVVFETDNYESFANAARLALTHLRVQQSDVDPAEIARDAIGQMIKKDRELIA